MQHYWRAVFISSWNKVEVHASGLYQYWVVEVRVPLGRRSVIPEWEVCNIGQGVKYGKTSHNERDGNTYCIHIYNY